MTDKEVIIDGVNVAGCQHYDNNSSGIYSIKDKGKSYCYDCSLNPNCDYKQLQRKEQGLKTAKEAYELCLANKEYRHKKEINRYKQALEEIKEIIEPDCDECRRNYYNQHCEECTTQIMLNIINEVLKDE